MLNWLFGKKDWKSAYDAGMRAGGSGNLDKAETLFSEAVSLAPNEPGPHYQLAYTYKLKKKLREAHAEYAATRKINPHFFLCAMSEEILGQHLDGKIGEDIVLALEMLQGLTDNRQGKSSGARNVAAQVTQKAPDCSYGHFYLAAALRGEDDSGAIREYRTALGQSLDAVTRVSAMINLSGLLSEAGEQDEARTVLQEIIDKHSDVPQSQFARISLAAMEKK